METSRRAARIYGVSSDSLGRRTIRRGGLRCHGQRARRRPPDSAIRSSIGRVADGPGDSFVLTGMNEERQNEVFRATTAGGPHSRKDPRGDFRFHSTLIWARTMDRSGSRTSMETSRGPSRSARSPNTASRSRTTCPRSSTATRRTWDRWLLQTRQPVRARQLPSKKRPVRSQGVSPFAEQNSMNERYFPCNFRGHC